MLSFPAYRSTCLLSSNSSHRARNCKPKCLKSCCEAQAALPFGKMTNNELIDFLLMTFVPVQKHIYMHFLYEFCYRMYTYMQQECHSVLVKLHPITFYGTVFLGSAQFLGWMPLFVSCDQAALLMVFSVCPSVCPSVCLSHLFDYVPIIVSSWNFQELLPMTNVRYMQTVKVKGQGHRGHNPT